MTETSNASLRESISALVDGETNDLDLQRVLKSFDAGDEARSTWVRYQTISAVLKGDRNGVGDVDLSASIRQAIADESEPAQHQFSGVAPGWRTLGKTAVAASVTFAVLVGVQQFTPDDSTTDVQIAETQESPATTGASVPQGFELPPLSARTVSTDSFANKANNPRPIASSARQNAVIIPSDALQEQINRLMFKHAEQVSSTGGLGAIPFARVTEISEADTIKEE